MATYSPVIREAEGGRFLAEVPAPDGCYTQGETLAEPLETAKEAIECHLEGAHGGRQESPNDERLTLATVSVDVTFLRPG